MNETMSALTDSAIRDALMVPAGVQAPANLLRDVMAEVLRRPRRHGSALSGRWQDWAPAAARLILFVALLLALIMSAVALSGLRQRGTVNGPVLIVVSDTLSAIDPVNGTVLATIPTQGSPQGIGRSPDGRLVAFWTDEAGAPRLWLAGTQGDLIGQVALGANALDVAQPGGIVFSPDGSQIATSASINGVAQLLLASVATSNGQWIATPFAASSPIFSPDGRSLAFLRTDAGDSVGRIAVVGTDGISARDLTGTDLDAHGADSWSADGWIYFGAASIAGNSPGASNANGVYRVNAADSRVELLTGSQVADAPALAPSGDLLTYEVWAHAGDFPDVWLMNADGTAARLLHERADIRGWAADSSLVLAELDLGIDGAELVAIPVAGGAPTVLLSDTQCITQSCFVDLSWGFPRP